MWRSTLALILIPALAAAQSQPLPAAHPQPRPTSTWPPTYRSYTYYQQIRQGTAEEVVVELMVPGWVSSPQKPAPGIIPVKLELDPAAGLAVTALRYPKPYTAKRPGMPLPLPLVSGVAVPIHFNIRAAKTAALGARVLTGKLTFQAVTKESSATAPQQLNVEIPLMVVDHGARVQKAQWPYTSISRGWIVLLIVLSPVLIPLGLLLMTVCSLTRGEPACE
ncbi:MAG TPA: hypothetical protein VMG31_16940 [Verrucomicrobiae bacterium]|nr:hypothetical protein [Verrucomicrobiae bacterium]